MPLPLRETATRSRSKRMAYSDNGADSGFMRLYVSSHTRAAWFKVLLLLASLLSACGGVANALSVSMRSRGLAIYVAPSICLVAAVTATSVVWRAAGLWSPVFRNFDHPRGSVRFHAAFYIAVFAAIDALAGALVSLTAACRLHFADEALKHQMEVWGSHFKFEALSFDEDDTSTADSLTGGHEPKRHMMRPL